MNATAALAFLLTAVTFYLMHHPGDYWVQTDHQAAHKGDAGWTGRLACLRHCSSYVLTQAVGLAAVAFVIGWDLKVVPTLAALAVSGVTHYLADRRAYGLMFRVAAWLEPIAGKANFLKLGVPRAGKLVTAHGVGHRDEEVPLDNPPLGTGSWALDQAWHIALGCFLPGLVMALAY